MATDGDSVAKLPRLTGAGDYIPWRRRIKAYIQRDDIELIELKPRPEGATTAQIARWNRSNIRAKSAIILTLANGPMAQISNIIDDDDRSAKDLWDALARLYTALNEQTVINLLQELETLMYKEGWN